MLLFFLLGIFTLCVISIQVLIYGWPLEQVNIFATIISTLSVQILVWRGVGHFPLSMHSLDATQQPLFFGSSKKSAWQAWSAYPEATEAFVHIAQHPYEPISLSSEHFLTLERFTVVLYHKSSSFTTVNEARRELFCKKSKSLENIPPHSRCPIPTYKVGHHSKQYLDD